MRQIIDWLIGWPERVATHLTWLAPLFARITVGWVFNISPCSCGWQSPAPARYHLIA